MRSGERVYGLGERWGPLDHREILEGGRALELTYPLEGFPVSLGADAAIPLGPAAEHTGQLAKTIPVTMVGHVAD